MRKARSKGGCPVVAGAGMLYLTRADPTRVRGRWFQALIEQYAAATSATPEIFLTGGDSPLLWPVLRGNVGLWPEMVLWPEMTLEGILHSAEGLP